MILQVNDHQRDAANQVNQLLNNQPNNQTNPSVAHCPDSLARWYCLNGATCFRVLVEDSILYNCLCRHGFHGARCDYKYTGGAASSYGNGNGTEQDDTVHRLEFMGASSDRMAALGLSGDDSLLSPSRIKNVATSGQGVRGDTGSPSPVLALICACLILMLVIAMCALLIQRFFRKRSPEQRQWRLIVRRFLRATFDRLTLGQAKMADRQMVSAYRAHASCQARQVAAHATPPSVNGQQVASREWDDTLRAERNLPSDYFREHAIELARQATHSDTCDWEQRPTVAAIHQAARVSDLFVQQPPVMTTKTTTTQAQIQRHHQQQQVAKGRVIRWPAGDNIGQAERLA